MTDTRDEPRAGGPPSVPCPHCACPRLVQIRASEVVTIYKCPECGELVAPVQKRPEP